MLVACVNIGSGDTNRFLEPGTMDMRLERETDETGDKMTLHMSSRARVWMGIEDSGDIRSATCFVEKLCTKILCS